MKNAAMFGLLLTLFNSSCSTTSAETPVMKVEAWGTMREVLKEGDARGRVRLKAVARPGTWGVGALVDLEGEVTIADGMVSQAVVEGDGLVHRSLDAWDGASLLILATVNGWAERELPAVLSLSDLEQVIATTVRNAGFDPERAPVPVRIEGEFERVDVHVIRGSCPLANPKGPPPWRFSGERVTGALIGIFAEGQEGVMTHHSRNAHLHAVLQTRDGLKVSGHLDDVVLAQGARLFLPIAGATQGAWRVEGP